MSRPRKTKSVDAQQASGAGNSIKTGGRVTIGLFVVARNYAGADTAEVALEVSPDGTSWAEANRFAGSNDATLTGSDLADPDSDGTYTAALTVQGVAMEAVRANIRSFTDDSGSDLEIDAWVLVSSNPAGAQDYRLV